MVDGDTLLPHRASGNILHAPDSYACQIHLNESFFHTTSTVAIPLNNGGLKGGPFELRYREGDVPRSGSEVAAVVAAAIALALFIALEICSLVVT